MFRMQWILLIFLLGACNLTNGLSTPAMEPDMISWSKTESPLFPSNWPPTADTVWVSYTFAYGSNPATLMDGAYVTSPLARTEWTGNGSTTTELSNEMKQASIQGVIPLDSQTLAILEKREQAFESCLNMTELPNLDKQETKEMLAYYQAWFKYNGAFLTLIREDHVDFIDWVSSNK